MSLSVLFEKSLKAQIVSILVRGNSRTVEQLFIELKKKSLSATKRGIYKALKDLLEQKVIIKYGTNYEINPDWISELGSDSNQALRKLLERNLLGVHVKDLKHLCECGKGYAEGFCSVCNELVCSHCGFEEIKHKNCDVKCLNCQCGNQENICSKCGKPVCLKCGKKQWIHEHQFCKKQDNKLKIGILEVDHNCWFSNISEKHPEEIMLNNFSDRTDIQAGTHSGVLKIEVEDKDKTIGRVIKEEIISEARLIHRVNKTYYIRTRASINESVDEFTRANNSILLNPVIAMNSKEQNLIISPSQKEMRQLGKGLQEFGGKVRVVSIEDFNLNAMNRLSKDIRMFLDRVPKKELLDNVQKIRLNGC